VTPFSRGILSGHFSNPVRPFRFDSKPGMAALRIALATEAVES